ncbi:STN domain-containing protein [Pseudomonas helleri]|uniref:STN domain-containing protein n=1 Tax=Pseudomonas helleri TaxID=1608996 RepID=UPI002F359FCE
MKDRSIPRPPLRKRSCVSAVSMLLLGGLVVTEGLLIPQVQAQTADRQIQFSVNPGPLDQALGQFGRQAAIALSTNASLTAGKTSQGLKGQYSVAEGLAHILAGSGYSAVQQANGAYLLVPQVAGALELGAWSHQYQRFGIGQHHREHRILRHRCHADSDQTVDEPARDPASGHRHHPPAYGRPRHAQPG